MSLQRLSGKILKGRWGETSAAFSRNKKSKNSTVNEQKKLSAVHKNRDAHMAAAGSTEAFSALPRTEGAAHTQTPTNNQALFPAYSLTSLACRPLVSCADLPQRSLWLKPCVSFITVNKRLFLCTFLPSMNVSALSFQQINSRFINPQKCTCNNGR